MDINRFNIRVYGICIHQGKVLLTNESYKDHEFVKFPGGGLEFGEGPVDCLIREFDEELSMEIEVIDHLYTTDFFQRSFFKQSDQIISIYYLVNPLSDFPISCVPDSKDHKLQSIFWKSVQELNTTDLTFPIDQHVLDLIKCM